MSAFVDIMINHISVQDQLEIQLRQMNEFLTMEERRAGIYLTEPPPDDSDGKPALTGKYY